ncbi:AfsR/SARP family transcriptional regulator [Catellatospora coxensis]|uniref:SARP family transcriptional regulator n=1 Tax=Catellatospora coxensis TaxID=310354 RepID=A0A8J3L117_9ACTN|nr:BTAD domain-containing putative transcriptional regulator [Catellatospora coxensis]GIG06651.1 SARP family transcriptional regulator [Catellatospora coxensis]
MEFQTLGPLQAVHDGQPAYLPTGHKPRLALAVLLARLGRPVPMDVLVEALWADQPPASARRNVHQYISQLRGALGTERIQNAPDGYTVPAGESLDAARFGELSAAAAAALDGGDVEAAARDWRTALDLWRGPAYAEFTACPPLADEALRLDQQRLAAYEGWAEAELALGRHRQVAGTLETLVAEQPFREFFRGCLMLARYRSGRRAEALDLFRDTRTLLRDELGLEPGPQLRALHEAILRDDARLTRPGRYDFTPEAPAAAAAPVTAPRQLPADVAGFTGRDEALRELDRMRDREAGPARVAVITGSAGIGKTSLVVHWAHRSADRFPDGQLHVNLRGFDAGGPPANPSQAVRGFLDALGVPSARVPADLAEQAALYRTLLAGRRMLLVLDNARDADQVRPLLPGTAGCMVLVTSRNQLSGLVAAEGARPLSLAVFTAAEARQLITHRLGGSAVEREPRAVRDVIARCGGLPLALAIVAARAASGPALPLAALAAELADGRDNLDAFSGDDAATDLRAVFSWSYRQLSDGGARMFRLLGLHPGPDVSLAAAASTAGLTVRQARPLLAELTRAHLAVEHAPGRFLLHDLMRAYAAELVAEADPEPDRFTALRRAYDHYLHTANSATLMVYPHRHRITILPCDEQVTPEVHADRDQAYAWFAAEHAVLLAVIRQAYELGCDGHTWQLAWTLITYFDRQGHWLDQAHTQRVALDAALRSGDVTGQAHVYHGLGVSSTWLERYDEAQQHYDSAMALFAQSGDAASQANTLLALTWLGERTTRYADAYTYAERAYQLHRATGDRSGQAKALNTMGWFQTLRGDHAAAITACAEALTLHQEVGDLAGQWETWDSLGHAHLHLGNHEQAVLGFGNALDLVRQTRDRYWEAFIVDHLADAQLALGEAGTADGLWRDALRIMEELAHPDAERIRAKLRPLDTDAAQS